MAASAIHTGDHMENNETKDWASELINHLLDVMRNSGEHITEGIHLDGVSVQKYFKGQFNVTFTFKN